MAGAVKLGFAPFASPSKGVLIVFTGEGVRLGDASRTVLGTAGGLLARVARAEGFTGKNGATLDIVAPAGLRSPASSSSASGRMRSSRGIS